MERTVTILAGVVLALMVTAGGADAQNPSSPGELGIGYVANAPDALVGGAVWGLIPGLHGWGLYVDVKVDPEDPIQGGYLYEALTPADVESQWPTDLEFSSNSRWRTFNLAVMKTITDELILYAGGGYAQEKAYRQYKDFGENRGKFGWYWVEDEDAARTGVNLMAGGFLRISGPMRIQFGGETRPKGFTVGLSYVFGGR